VDPRTGWPVEGRAGVTVLAPSAMEADALSTALFVLGPGEGIRLSIWSGTVVGSPMFPGGSYRQRAPRFPVSIAPAPGAAIRQRTSLLVNGLSMPSAWHAAGTSV